MTLLDRLLRRRAEPAPATRTTARGWDGGTPRGRREFGSFNAINAEAAAAAPRLVSRCRRLFHDNGFVRNGIEAIVAAAWGPDGTRPVGVGKRALARWQAESRRQNFPLLLRTMIADMIVSGEGLGVWNGADLTVLPREQLSDESDGRNLISGVDVDPLGRPAAYRVLPGLPESADYRPAIRVLAADALHLFRVETAGQVRGIPWAAAAIVPASELQAALDASAVRWRNLASMVLVHTKAPDDTTPRTELFEEFAAPLMPGSVVHLNYGETLSFPQSQPPGEFNSLTAIHVRQIAAALGVPPHMVDGNFAEINYSSARAAMLSFRARIEAVQHMTVRPILDRIWTRVTGTEAPPEWLFQPLPSVDPQKQLMADKAEYELGLTSRRRLAAERGWDLADLDAELQAEGRTPPKETK